MKKKIIIISIVTVLMLCVLFIFSNSIKDSAQSTLQSGTAKKIIDRVFSALHINIDISEQSLRTFGHFAEFFALSAILSVSALLLFPFNFKNPFTKNLFIYFSPIVISVIVALADEFIQLFSPGRACDIIDAAIDTAGAACANILIMGIVFIIYFVKKRKA